MLKCLQKKKESEQIVTENDSERQLDCLFKKIRGEDTNIADPPLCASLGNGPWDIMRVGVHRGQFPHLEAWHLYAPLNVVEK